MKLRNYLLANVCRAPETGAGSGGVGPITPPAPVDPDISVFEAPADTPSKMSVHEAARTLAGVRFKRQPQQQREQSEAPQQQDAAAQGETESTVDETGDAASQTGEPETPGETEGVEPPAQEEAPALAPIEPPRSWTKEAKDRWQSLPRATQEYLASREQERDRDLRRSQNEAAEKLKGLSAKEQEVEKARQQYDQALPQVLAMLNQQYTLLEQQHLQNFADVKTWDDLERVRFEDQDRYQRFDLSLKKIEAAKQQSQIAANEVAATQQRQERDKRQKFQDYASAEDKAFIAAVPDMAKPEKAAELQGKAVSVLKDLGFDETELAQSWNGQKDLSLRDHRVQLLLRDAILWREAQAKAKTVKSNAKPIPPVARPGVSQPKGAVQAARVDNLSKSLDNKTGMSAVRTAAALVRARREAR